MVGLNLKQNLNTFINEQNKNVYLKIDVKVTPIE